MAVYISKKKALIRFALSFFSAAAVLALSFHVLKGPRLGPHYDYLLQYVEPVPVSGELLLVETRLPQPVLPESANGDAALPEDFIEPASLVSVLMTMTEMNTGSLVIQTPVSAGPFPGGTDLRFAAPDELRSRFDGEFNLVERNIRNLFEAIRLGFILPAEADRYVGELISITGRGKERLLRALFPSDRSDRSPLERASAVFGRVWVPGAAGEGYYNTQADGDGKIRRVVPSIGQGEAVREHLVYAALKDRLPAEFSFPSDDQGALLFVPLTEGDFRRIPLAAFLEYEEADRELFRLLSNAESQGIYAGLDPESYPGNLYGYARNLWEELLREPDQDRKTRWLDARAGYFQSLDDFFNGPSETSLVDGYERMIASESLGVEGIRRITALRNELILSFRNLRESYAELLEKRAFLELELSNSFCILGPPDSALENSAILANTLLTQRTIIPGQDQDTLRWSLIGILVILAGISLLGPWISLGAGLLLAAVLGVIFSYSFVLRAYWMDPLIPLSAAAAGVLVSFSFALLVKYRSTNRLRRAYGSRMAGPYLRRLIRAGRPLPSETCSAKAAIVAIRDGSLNGIENRSSPQESAKAAAAFWEEAFRLFSKAGAVMTGLEGDLVVFAFGSPLERQAMKKMKTILPDDGESIRAAELVLDILKNAPQAASWRFAIDAGECSFSWSPAAGYTASGHAVVSARIFSKLCSRYKTRILVSSRIAQKLGGAWRLMGAMVDQGGGEREEFFGLGDS
ncbi:hypothetical protein [Treponema primitia]|uniref:hypothetical protein n=1 Tax=Treponema primitia TaxID=88058 RepID=UPI0002554D88|nr:hypothetical protein [Treponema primitia]